LHQIVLPNQAGCAKMGLMNVIHPVSRFLPRTEQSAAFLLYLMQVSRNLTVFVMLNAVKHLLAQVRAYLSSIERR
jgi:hypothetical protein